MSRFEPVTLTYKGKDYEVEPERVWGLIGAIEEHITFDELGTALHKGRVPEAKVSEAFSAAMRYVGVRAKPEDIQLDLDKEQRYANAYGLWLVLLEAQPDIKKKIKEAAQGRAGSKKKQPATKR